MELEVGMYVRTEKDIGKVTECRKHDKWGYIIKILGQYSCFTHSSNKELSDVIKASHNIIDLIEVGDYVNGSKVVDISIIGKDKEKWVWVEQMEDTDNKYGDDYVGYNNEQIKSIVTKEQFEAMEYKVESEVK